MIRRGLRHTRKAAGAALGSGAEPRGNDYGPDAAKRRGEAGPGFGTNRGLRTLAADVGAEIALLGDRAELLQRGCFDLADALAREVERLAHLFEGVTGAAVHPEPQTQQLLLPRRQQIEERPRLRLHPLLRELLVR